MKHHASWLVFFGVVESAIKLHPDSIYKTIMNDELDTLLSYELIQNIVDEDTKKQQFIMEDHMAHRKFPSKYFTLSTERSQAHWLPRKRAAKAKGKKSGFEFPEASNRVKTIRDGHHVIDTGMYKPQMRVWDLDRLSLKFERHSDAENVDFVIISSCYRTRIPRFGRSIVYHFPSCDAYISASGNEIYRLNLDQGRFMIPFVLQETNSEILGVNTIDINPAHQLLAFGIEGNGTAQFWDPGSRSCEASVLQLYHLERTVCLMPTRYNGLPVKNVTWIEGGSRMPGDGMVLSADKKVIKIWDHHSPTVNFASITPASDSNDVHHIPGSRSIMTANERIQVATMYPFDGGISKVSLSKDVGLISKSRSRDEMYDVGAIAPNLSEVSNISFLPVVKGEGAV
ncbi:hypothetical protein BYT27DRAFT_7333950 [Phlegmacium glaucopus]|nr:hypothetical protein BYT27DRAFT_7333950 [Phlegmacium glaucopus]